MKYSYALGRRKTAAATVRLFKGSDKSTVNGKDSKVFFPTALQQQKLELPFAVTNTLSQYYFTAKTVGGGVTGQLDAILLGIARALIKENPEMRPELKKAGLLSRDDRMVERKKTGQPKARKKPQYSKR
jgi:small subunit ribosomal protein S9